MNLKNKVAIITGSSKGIGLQIAHSFAEMGCKVVINSRNQTFAKEIASLIQKKYKVQSIGIGANVSLEKESAKIVEETLNQFGKIDILVNNAGIAKDNLILRMKEGDWDQVLKTNLKSAFLMSKLSLRPMLRERNGRIINLSSVVGQMGNPGQVNYCASKGGIIAFTKALAKEVAGKQITVNAIAPGFIETEMTKQMNEKAKAGITEAIPLKRLGNTKDIADSACFLASERASYITGQVLSVNGGLFM